MESVTGQVEKLDGPYYLMKFLTKLNQTRIGKRVKKFPLPISDSGIMPLVPVDLAARVFHQALFLPKLDPGQKEFYGLFNSSSVRVETLIQCLFSTLLPHCKPVFLNRSAPSQILDFQAKFTQIPKEAFYYVQSPIGLENTPLSIYVWSRLDSAFENYQSAYFDGFKRCFFGEGMSHASL